MRAVWPNAVVEENNLNQNISIVRRALGETAGEHRFIVTVPGRGFRFVPQVERLAQRPSLASEPTPVAAAQPALAGRPDARASTAGVQGSGEGTRARELLAGQRKLGPVCHPVGTNDVQCS